MLFLAKNLSGETVTMLFPTYPYGRKVVLLLDDHSRMEFSGGPQEVPVELKDHPYLAAHGVVPYQKHAPVVMAPQSPHLSPPKEPEPVKEPEKELAPETQPSEAAVAASGDGDAEPGEDEGEEEAEELGEEEPAEKAASEPATEGKKARRKRG